MRKLFAAATALCVSATSLNAQWSQVGGDYQMQFDFRTTAALSCMKEIYNSQPCTSDGTTVTQWNGGAFATVSFTGVTGATTASGYANGPIRVGTLNVRYGGSGAFTWPSMVAPGIGSFAMFVTLQTLNAPNAAWSRIRFQFMQISPSLIRAYLGEAQSNYISLAIPHPQPFATTYRDLVFDNFNMPHIDKLTDADYDIYATSVSVIPEPSTYALTAFGLAAIAFMARRKRNYI